MERVDPPRDESALYAVLLERERERYPAARADGGRGLPYDLGGDEVEGFGEPEDVAALVVYLLSERARAEGITGQVYTVVGPKIAVWAQPRELRAGYAEGAWTPERIADFLPGTVGVDPMPMLGRVGAMAAAAAAGTRPNA